MSSKVTLTGHFTLLDGTPAVGTVLIRPSRSPLLDLDGKQVIAGPQRFTLDADGRFSADLPPTDDPALGEDFTYHVMVSMDHTHWQVIGLTLPAGMTSVDVLDPPAGAVKEYPTRAEWDALTGAAVAEMESALDGAETARDVSVEARDATVVACDDTLEARDETLTARDTAVGAASEAETARTETLTARDVTLTARDETVEARDETFIARKETTTVAGEAESARDTAVVAAGEAEVARDVAVGAAGEAETARLSAWEAVDTPGRQGPPGEVTTADLTAALAGKVTGQGMTLRHDTTVGERVFLDHPGGSTVLSGDTGWRDVTPATIDADIPNTHARVFLRRTTHLAELYVQINATSPAQKLYVTYIPPGFRPKGFTDAPFAFEGSKEVSGLIRVDANGNLTIRVLASGNIRASFVWHTNDSWPTALPGTPA